MLVVRCCSSAIRAQAPHSGAAAGDTVSEILAVSRPARPAAVRARHAAWRQDVPGIPQDVLAGEEDVPGTSYVDALQDLAAASGGGPHGELVAAAATVVRALPP
ncbi:hypothetical protein [Actinomadura luteofluorescens]|uniref:hypothetical protein n=1 Tax=Actinomadura luteofluorescens TaxID=46163 RepID=UPI003D89D18F